MELLLVPGDAEELARLLRHLKLHPDDTIVGVIVKRANDEIDTIPVAFDETVDDGAWAKLRRLAGAAS